MHPIVYSIHPIREMGCKYRMCVIWGVKRKPWGVNKISQKEEEKGGELSSGETEAERERAGQRTWLSFAGRLHHFSFSLSILFLFLELTAAKKQFDQRRSIKK